MKLSAARKRTQRRTRPEHYVRPEQALPEHVDSVPQDIPTDDATAFLMLMADAGQLQRKDFQYGMSVSKELVKMWFEGVRRNPLKAAQDCVALFPARLVPTILEYIAGGNFMVLEPEERTALMKLAQRAQGKRVQE